MARKPGTPKVPGSGRKRGTPNRLNILSHAAKAQFMQPWEVWDAVLRGDKKKLGLPEDFEITLFHKLKAARDLAPYLYPVPKPPREGDEVRLGQLQVEQATAELELLKIRITMLRAEAESKGLSLDDPPFDPDV